MQEVFTESCQLSLLSDMSRTVIDAVESRHVGLSRETGNWSELKIQ